MRSRWLRRASGRFGPNGSGPRSLSPTRRREFVRSRFPAVSVFAANRADAPVGRITAAGPEDALVTRPALDVAVRRLPPGGAAFVERLIAGSPLGVAADAALAESPDFDLAAGIAGILEAGAFCGVEEGKMNLTGTRAPAAGRGLPGLVARAAALVQTIATPSLTQFALRLGLAVPFWRSGVNKWDGVLQLNDVAVLLFTSEFKLHLPGGPYDYPAPAVVAFLSGTAEVVLPVLLVLGLGTRFAAAALLAMTALIEVTVPEGWPVHVTWAAMALGIMAWGPGRLSIDGWLARR